MITREHYSSLSKQKKVLIFGVDSQIGRNLKIFLIKNNFQVFGTTRRKENIDKNTYYVDLKQPNFDVFDMEFDYVVFCAAVTGIACEEDAQKSRLINVTGTLNAIDRLIGAKSFLIYLSSSDVFNGAKPFYKHTDKTSPLTLYGKFKNEVEEYITNKFEDKSAILRLTKVISKETPFLARWRMEAEGKNVIKTFKNKFLSPIQISDVIESINLLILQKENGIFQLGGHEEISYTNYAKIFFKDSPSVLKLISAQFDDDMKNLSVHNSLATFLPDKENQNNLNTR